MRIFVTGGTGFIGKRLVRRLVAAGHAVTVLTRDASRAGRDLPARVSTRGWNPAGPVDPDLLRGADAVVHLAGAGVADGRWTQARKREIRESRVLGTRTLVQALGALPERERPRTFVSASAIGFYGDRGDATLDESAPPGKGFLADVCVDWEREARNAESSGARVVIVRVGIVLGADGGALSKMLVPFRLGLGGRVSSGAQWMSWIHVDDVAALFAWALENDRASGVVNGVAPNPVTNATFTVELGRALRRPAPFPIPAPALRLLLGEMSILLLNGQRVVPTTAERLGFPFQYRALPSALSSLCADQSRELVREQWLARPPEEVFPFFANPYNLERLTPEFLRFKILGVDSEKFGEGSRIDYRLVLHGIPVRWQSRIAFWRPNESFVDEQTRGPYRRWCHTHEFEAADGGTIIRDRVRYVLPFGVVGELVAGKLVERDLETIFDYRRRQVSEALA